MICFEYCGYCSATSAALENDFSSSEWTLTVILSLSGAEAIAAEIEAA